MFAVPLSPRRHGGQTLRDTACFTPSFDTFLPRPFTWCVWGSAKLFVGIARAATGPQNAPKAVFDPESAKKWRGAAPLRTLLQRGDTPLRNPPCPAVLAASAAKRVATFFGNFYWVCMEEMGFLGPFLVQLGVPMKWAGLEMPKSVAVHQRVKWWLYHVSFEQADWFIDF